MGVTAPTRDTLGAASLALSESLYFSVLAFALMPDAGRVAPISVSV